ncbi:MAG: bis(5'-nucleosyl)-tetraphosphatase (symmetrical) YqeK [Acutalibacteraceae bacterium]|nr:bis(5'-nucleosyl)-tetraphosphatase (symmetrical) YqeK [Acutalibacteraceae bacterium]
MAENKTDYESLKAILQKRLNEKRYYHSLCVADEAKRLAEKYGGNPDKAYLSGLLHDITKNAPDEEHLQIFKEFGIILTDIEQNAKKLWHAMSGALYVKNILEINDPEIIDAVRYHTTAKAKMSLLAKILYLADFTSIDRDYEDVDVIREYVDESLEKAFIYALQYSITDLVNQGRAVHPDTVEAYNQAVLIN